MYNLYSPYNINDMYNMYVCNAEQCNAMPCHVMSCHAMPCHVMSCHVCMYICIYVYINNIVYV